MKIVYFITKSHWGGAAKYVTDLAAGLDQNVFEIIIASGGMGPLKDKSEALGIQYLEVSHFGRRIAFIADLLSFFEVLRILRKERPDAIHTNSSKAGGVCGLAGFIYKLLGNRLLMIFTAHGWAFHEARPMWQKVLIRFFSRLTAYCYDTIICITALDYNSALRYKIAPKKKLVLIPNGVNIDHIKFLRRKDAQEKIFGEEQELVVGTIGEWVRNKGWDILFDGIQSLFEKYPKLILALIAGGESPEKKYIAHEKIKIIENLPDAHQYLKAFDIFIFPSRKEGFPYALLEASLAELPIIATAVGGNLDIINSDKTGVLIPPENPEVLGTALERMIQNPKEAKKLGKNARERVEKNFSLAKMRERTYKLY